MARLASRVVNAARDRHPAFDRQRSPDGPVYRFLADYCQEAQGKIMQIDPSYGDIEQTIVFELPLLDFDAGMALGAVRVITDIVLVNKATEPKRITTPITLIPREQRFSKNPPTAAAWQEGGNLYLRAPAETYTNYGSVEVQVIQHMTDEDVDALLLTPNATLPLPDAASGMVVAALALYMARRGCSDPNVPAIDVAGFERDAAASASAFYEAVAQRNVSRTFVTLDVANYGYY
jgi:hypothetical protein